MSLVVGQKIMLRRVISLLRQDGEGPQSDAAKAALSTNGTDILPGFNLAEELSNPGGGGLPYETDGYARRLA